MDKGDPEACTDDVQEVDVILIDGTLKRNYSILLFNTVVEEKERIWQRENQQGPPQLQDLALVLLGPHGTTKVLEDNKALEWYLDDLASGTIKFVPRSLAKGKEGRVVNPTVFNTGLKQP